ncbi:sulfotransferase 1C4-like [Ylistrum balloti]|uniref:sulfotransferase 1C4-like n=1 Tax=Ylistrum balloti TaxID=509963 RepID=UPI002905EFC1|nr:sulfotransferase 1C4-like [Ylistrum balloti]
MICQLQHRSLEYAGSPFLLEFENLSQMNTLGSVRTYATHLTYPFIPEEAKQGNIKVINVTRNPKDVFCSLFEYQSRLNNRLFQGSFNGFFHQFVSDGLPTCGASWFTHVKEWEIAKKSNPRMRCLSLRYEDLIRNPFSSILKLAKFLEADYDENFLRKVEQTLTFENMRKEHNTQKGKTSKYLTWVTDGRLPIYRKGVIGDWKQKLTVKQNELFDEAYLEKMAGMPFDLSFVYE